MAASRRLARKLPSIISKHHRLISPEIETLDTLEEDSTSPPSIRLDPTLPLLPLAVSHLCVHCPQIRRDDYSTEPLVVSSAKDLALLSFAF
jgi:hypothetical protein